MVHTQGLGSIRGRHQSALKGSKREALQSCGTDGTWTYHESASQGRETTKGEAVWESQLGVRVQRKPAGFSYPLAGVAWVTAVVPIDQDCLQSLLSA